MPCPSRGRASTAPGDRVAQEEQVALPGQLAGLGDGAVGQGHLRAGRDVEPGLDDAVVAEGDAQAGLGSEQATLADAHAFRAAAGQGAHGRRAAPDVGAVADDDALADPALDHRGAEGAGVEVDEALVHDRGAAGEVGTEPHPVGVARCARRSARRSRSSAGTCRRRTPGPVPRARSRTRVSSKPSTAHGPCEVHTTLVSTPNRPSRLIELGRTSRCESRCSRSQPSVVSAGGTSRSTVTRRTSRAHATRVVRRREGLEPAGAASSPAPPGSPSAGDGNQASSTVPSSVRVSRPWPQAVRVMPPQPKGCTRGHVRVAGMPTTTTALDLTTDVISLTAAVCDIESVSLDEEPLADAVEAALRDLAHLDGRPAIGNTVVARTELGRDERVVLAGHIDTVPLTATRRTCRPAGSRAGRGALGPRHGRHEGRRRRHAPDRPRGARAEPRRHVRLLRGRGDRLEVQRPAARRGAASRADRRRRLRRAARADRRPGRGRLQGHPARRGRRPRAIASHSARPWKGHNAIHDAADVLARLVGLRARHPRRRRAGVPRGAQRGGASTAASPPTSSPTGASSRSTTATHPSLSEEEADAHVRQVFAGFHVDVIDNAGGARPGLHLPAAKAFVEALGLPVRGQAGLDRRRPLLGDGGARPSTSAPATPTSPTWTTSSARSSSTSPARPPCCAGSPEFAGGQMPLNALPPGEGHPVGAGGVVGRVARQPVEALVVVAHLVAGHVAAVALPDVRVADRDRVHVVAEALRRGTQPRREPDRAQRPHQLPALGGREPGDRRRRRHRPRRGCRRRHRRRRGCSCPG